MPSKHWSLILHGWKCSSYAAGISAPRSPSFRWSSYCELNTSLKPFFVSHSSRRLSSAFLSLFTRQTGSRKIIPCLSSSATTVQSSGILLTRRTMGTQTGGSSEGDIRKFQEVLQGAEKVVVLTGAGVSAESGIPTFRGAGGLWRTWDATELATPEAFDDNPSLVWEFYSYRREVVARAQPNPGHRALAELEQACAREGKAFCLLTQNIDGLHVKAGSERVVELHGSLWRTRCTRCGREEENRDVPICQALAGKGAPDPSAPDAALPLSALPRCRECRALLRPAVVWFGEQLGEDVREAVDGALEGCSLMLVVGTSAVVQPAGGYARLVSALGGTIAEFNVEDSAISSFVDFSFRGPSGETLPRVLGHWTQNPP